MTQHRAQPETAATRSRQGGFTMIEMLIVMSVLAVIMAAIGNVTGTTNDAVEMQSRGAEVATLARRNLQRIAAFVRPAKLSTFQAQAVEDDVTALRATSVGEWISPTDKVWRPGIAFESASGLLSMNAALSTAPRELTFEMDSGETANGIDDDGDDLVDEGMIRLVHDGVTLTVVRNIELCEFELDGRLLGVRVRVASRDSKGRVHRALVEQYLYMRNN